MTAPIASSPSRTVEATHSHLHARWRKHVTECARCLNGFACRIADRYADAADDAGKAWTLAEEAEARAARMARAGA